MKHHSSQFLKLVNEAKARIKEISPQMLKEKMDRHENFHLIDVREANEWQTGHIPGAIHLSKGLIERDIEMKIPDFQAQVIVYCSGGFRCALVADTLKNMGYQHVYSLDTGSQGWVNAGNELVK